jgi:hypothetical protein
MESISVHNRMQSSENSIYVGNSAIRTVTVHLANGRVLQPPGPGVGPGRRRAAPENAQTGCTRSGIYHVGNYGIWTLVTCQRHSPTVVCFTLIDQAAYVGWVPVGVRFC